MTGTRLDIRCVSVADEAGIWEVLRPVFRAGETYAIDRDIGREDALRYWTDGHA